MKGTPPVLGDRVEIRMPGLSHHERVGTLVALNGIVGRVKFGDDTEILVPYKALRKRF